MLLKQLFKFQPATVLLWVQAAFLLVLLAFGFITSETVVFGYFFETIIIGFIHIIKLFLVIKHGKPDKPDANSMSGYGMLVFFLFHYGMFVAIQLIFAFSFFEGVMEGIESGFELLHNFKVLLNSEGMLIMLGSLLLTNLGYFYSNFWITFKYKEYAPSEIFFSPYVRIVIQQLVVILSGFFFVFLQAGFVAAVLLLVLRLFIDLVMVTIRKDSDFLNKLAFMLVKNGQDPQEVREQLEKLSE
ncbi:DUF6498-containing protein [Rasiella sp. SM2506]|uniref:DUF6498-containing protein n=1 Tax=Rasiella sp. SM2506 TaxID=3423914 RepID=UPI003D7A0459